MDWFDTWRWRGGDGRRSQKVIGCDRRPRRRRHRGRRSGAGSIAAFHADGNDTLTRHSGRRSGSGSWRCAHRWRPGGGRRGGSHRETHFRLVDGFSGFGCVQFHLQFGRLQQWFIGRFQWHWRRRWRRWCRYGLSEAIWASWRLSHRRRWLCLHSRSFIRTSQSILIQSSTSLQLHSLINNY